MTYDLLQAIRPSTNSGRAIQNLSADMSGEVPMDIGTKTEALAKEWRRRKFTEGPVLTLDVRPPAGDSTKLMPTWDWPAAENDREEKTEMPLFEMTAKTLKPIGQGNFSTEKELQRLIEQNLRAVFDCRVIASEFPTGPGGDGRIDTLALSEDGHPAIIEYKKVESSALVNQSLSYFWWLDDHHGDFEKVVRETLGKDVTVDWSHIRVICIAPNYRKFDVRAVQVIGTAVELWQYRVFENGVLYLEEVLRKSSPVGALGGTRSRKQREKLKERYTLKEHLAEKPQRIADLAIAVEEYVLGLDAAMTEVPKKFYIAYKISQNIVCMEVKKSKVILYLKLNPKAVLGLPPFARNVTKIGHYGTGDLELTLKNEKDLEEAKPFIDKAYERVGG